MNYPALNTPAMQPQQSLNNGDVNGENHINLPQFDNVNANAAAQAAVPATMAGATLAELRRDDVLAQAAAQRWMELGFDDNAPNESTDNLHSFWS